MQNMWLYIAGGVVALLLLLVAVRVLTGRKAPAKDPDRGLDEDLADYPPPPADPGPKRLMFDGQPARVRLIVVAPVGRAMEVDAAAVEPLLDQVVRGLGTVVQKDKPRVRVWPAQLSHQGFAVKFQRSTHKPDPDNVPSRWVLLSGTAKAGKQQVLLGLALLADEETDDNRRTLEAEQWGEVLHVKAAG